MPWTSRWSCVRLVKHPTAMSVPGGRSVERARRCRGRRRSVRHDDVGVRTGWSDGHGKYAVDARVVVEDPKPDPGRERRRDRQLARGRWPSRWIRSITRTLAACIRCHWSVRTANSRTESVRHHVETVAADPMMVPSSPITGLKGQHHACDPASRTAVRHGDPVPESRYRQRSATSSAPSSYDSRMGDQTTMSGLPEPVRRTIEDLVGGPVDAWKPATGGMTPSVKGTAAVKGLRMFVKAISDSVGPLATLVFQREARINDLLPNSLRRPALIGADTVDGWVTLVFEQIDGHHVSSRVGSAEFTVLADASRDVAQHSVPDSADIPRYVKRWGPRYDGWQRILTTGGYPPVLMSLERPRDATLRALAHAERSWRDAADGSALLHGDLSADNLIIAPTGPVLIDWSNACRGAPWLDVAALTPELLRAGTADPVELFKWHPVTALVPTHAIVSFVAALTGYWAETTMQAESSDGLPGINHAYTEAASITLPWLLARIASSPA